MDQALNCFYIQRYHHSNGGDKAGIKILSFYSVVPNENVFMATVTGAN